MSNTTIENKKGYFGQYGGQYVPAQIKTALNQVSKYYERFKDDKQFRAELEYYLKDYSGRPTPLYYAESLSKYLGGAKIYLKREDLNHLGAHKLNNVLGQILLAKRMGKKRIIAETGAGQHGTATAAAAAKFGMKCEIYMGAKDVERQKLNVFRMNLLGAKVNSVKKGNGTLKEAIDAAFVDFGQHLTDTFYVVGSAVGPDPYPRMVKDFQSVISQEMKQQILAKEGRLPDAIVACVGGGSNAIGSFANFLGNKNVRLIGAEAAGKGADTPDNAATLTNGSVGIAHGMKSYFLQEENGELKSTYSISAGLDYPGVGPEHALLKDIKRAEYYPITDKEALEAFVTLSKKEGIIPALESSHAVAQGIKMASKMPADQIIVINLSGRGDKDVEEVGKMLNFRI